VDSISKNWRSGMTDSTSFRRTLRQMAEAEDAHDRRRLFDMLASQIEVAFDNQASNTQVVLWDVQEAAYKKIDALHEHQADTNLLLAGVAESLAAIQASVQQVLNAHGEDAARLGKTEADVRDLELRMENSEHLAADTRDRLTRLEAVNERLASIEEVMASRPALREAEYRAIAERAAEEAIRRLEARGDGDG
jgi:hypothetical protein